MVASSARALGYHAPMQRSSLSLRIVSVCALGVALLAGCASDAGSRDAARSEARASAAAPEQAREKDYTLIFLVGGPGNPMLTPDEVKAAGEGHFANMRRLAHEGVLLLAGPFVDPKVDSKLRGLFLFDRAEPMDALEIAGSDPAVQAGLLALQAVPCASADELGRSLALWAEANERGEEPEMTSYVLAVCEASEAGVARALDRDARVLFALRLKGARAGEQMLLLDEREPESARALLEEHGAEPTRWTLHPWYSTSLLRLTRASQS